MSGFNYTKRRVLKKLFVVLTAFMLTSSLFAVEEYVSMVYKQIDDAFVKKSEEMLDEILKDNQNDRFYYLMENYTQKKIRRLILSNDYTFAKQATLVVIDNNLDNLDAVEMYSLIIDAIAIQKEAEEKKQLAAQAEAERIEKEKEKARNSTEKEYVAAPTASGKGVYLSADKDLPFTRYLWKGQLGMVNVAAVAMPSVKEVEYGVSADFSFEYTASKFNLGIDLSGGFNFMSFTNSSTSSTILVNFDIMPKFSLTLLSRKLYFRGGISDYMVGVEGSKTSFLTPALGVQLSHFKLGLMELTGSFDYYPAHLWTNQYFAGGMDVNLELPFAEFDKTKWNFNFTVKDRFSINSVGLDNKIHFVVAIGAKNVVR